MCMCAAPHISHTHISHPPHPPHLIHLAHMARHAEPWRCCPGGPSRARGEGGRSHSRGIGRPVLRAGSGWSAARARGCSRQSGASGACCCMASRASSASPFPSPAGAAVPWSRPHATPCWGWPTRCSPCSPTSSCGTTTPRPPPLVSKSGPAPCLPPPARAPSPLQPSARPRIPPYDPRRPSTPRKVAAVVPFWPSRTSHAHSHPLCTAGGARVPRRLPVLCDRLPPRAAAAHRTRARAGEHSRH